MTKSDIYKKSRGDSVLSVFQRVGAENVPRLMVMM